MTLVRETYLLFMNISKYGLVIAPHRLTAAKNRLPGLFIKKSAFITCSYGDTWVTTRKMLFNAAI